MNSTTFEIPTIDARLIEKVTLDGNADNHSINDQFAQIWVDNKAKFVQITVNSDQEATVIVYFQNDQHVTTFVGKIFANGRPQVVPMPSGTRKGNYTVGVVCGTQTHTGSFSIL